MSTLTVSKTNDQFHDFECIAARRTYINPFVAKHLHEGTELVELVAIFDFVDSTDTPFVEVRALGYVVWLLQHLWSPFLHAEVETPNLAVGSLE